MSSRLIHPDVAIGPERYTSSTEWARRAFEWRPGEFAKFTGDPVLTRDPADDRAEVLAFSPDGTRLLTGSERGSAIVWDVRRGQGPSTPKR